MSRRKKKGKAHSLIHYFINLKDREAWGSATMCGKKGSGTWDHKKVTCKKCHKGTNWTVEQYDRACAKPMILCPACEPGQLRIRDVRPTKWLAACSHCDLLQWRDRPVD